MMLKTIIFLKCFLLTLGLIVNEMTNKEDLLEQPLTLSWETQQFLGDRSLVEEESLGELVVLRERRDTRKTKKEADDETGRVEGSGGGDPCALPNNCSTYAACQNSSTTSDSYTCQCKKGFYGDGKICTDCNECLANEHGLQKKCNNYPEGSLHTPSPCSQVCTNTIGSFKCSCATGYYLGSDLKFCNDINECSEEKERCSQNCINTIGSFKCSCTEGFYLGSDLKSCNEILITTVMATIGGTAVLICTLNENHVIWKKNGYIVENSTKLIISKNVLIFKEVNEDDFGKYVCDIKTYANITITIKLENISKPDKIPFGYLIPLILLAILFLFSIMLIAYLVYSRRKELSTAQDNVNGERDNEGIDNHEMIERNRKSENRCEPDNIYTDLNAMREEEPTYQGLTNQSGDGIYENSTGDDKVDGDKEETEVSNVYEPLDLDCKSKV